MENNIPNFTSNLATPHVTSTETIFYLVLKSVSSNWFLPLSSVNIIKKTTLYQSITTGALKPIVAVPLLVSKKNRFWNSPYDAKMDLS
jgi:hypothetical protein